MKKRINRHHRGMGVFFVILISIVVLIALVGFFQLVHSRQVTDQVLRSSLGQVALTLAESAAAEGLHGFRVRANDPRDPLYQSLRHEVYAGERGDVSADIKLQETKRLLRRDDFRRYWLDDFSVRVAFQRQFDRVPYETWGIVVCRVTVGTNLSLTERITRTVEVGAELRVTLPNVPRPFDQVTFMALNAGGLIRDVEYRIEESLRALEALAHDRREFLETLRIGPSSLSETDVDNVSDHLQAIFIPERRTMMARIRSFVDPSTLFSVNDQVNLSDIHLGLVLERAQREVDQFSEDYFDARRALEMNLDSKDAHRRYRDSLINVVAAHRNLLEEVIHFQESFTLQAGNRRQHIMSFVPKLGLSSWRRKAAFIIEEDEDRHINAQVDQLKERIDPLNGVLLVDNPSQPLDLEGPRGRFGGRVVIATTGSVRVGRGTSPRDEDDLLTIVSFGNLIVDDDCRCALIAHGPVSIREHARIHGTLIVREVRDTVGLQGMIQRDARLFSGRTVPGDTSGAFIDYYHVAVGPGEVYRAIVRR